MRNVDNGQSQGRSVTTSCISPFREAHLLLNDLLQIDLLGARDTLLFFFFPISFTPPLAATFCCARFSQFKPLHAHMKFLTLVHDGQLVLGSSRAIHSQSILLSCCSDPRIQWHRMRLLRDVHRRGHYMVVLGSSGAHLAWAPTD
ncbi:hypothetical protein CBOM_08141 [Ceraceosorus bombacis]|uniref:Uncharacterized protein n=1 Tax=Ceraceosorus bombacis TaxID=401625 RepID=A0A0P1BA56_9BASI|nr:hypothetical protein CBOM_08141 [Ceraceosorus bombacis]